MTNNGFDDSITSSEGQFKLPPISLDGIELPKRRFTFTPQFPLSYDDVRQIWSSLYQSEDESLSKHQVGPTATNTQQLEGFAQKNEIAHILLLVDRQGSMTPVHRFVDQVCAGIKDSSDLVDVIQYYFHDVPAEGVDERILQSLPKNELFPTLDTILSDIKPLTEGFLYEDADLLSPQALHKVLETDACDAAVVIISDAGAACGQYDTLRLLDTIAFLKTLRTYTTRYIWLNPQPQTYWAESTAAQIARYVPMFSLDKAGMQQAINTLQGQPYLTEASLNQIKSRQQTTQDHPNKRNVGQHTLGFACHAALPATLNSELLHFLRINFFLDAPEVLPYTAETDLLLSPLCQEIGEDLYEIYPKRRDELLQGLGVEYPYERFREIALLLWQYIERRAPSANDVRLERAQQLTALSVIDPQKAEQWIEKTEKSLKGAAAEEREWLAVMRKEIQKINGLNLEYLKRLDLNLPETDALLKEPQVIENIQLIDLPLKQIIDGCRRKQEDKCFELFRRAFDEKNEEAKSAVYHQYRKLIFDWTHKALAGHPVTEQEVEDIASQGTVRFFRHLSRVSVVERYDHVAQIIGYLKKCVKSSAIDFARKTMRAKGNQDEWIDKVLQRKSSYPSPEKEVEQEQFRQQISELAAQHLDDVERLYIQLKFRHGLTPREMVEMYPETFPNSREVYKIWDRIKKRLRPLFQLYLK